MLSGLCICKGVRAKRQALCGKMSSENTKASQPKGEKDQFLISVLLRFTLWQEPSSHPPTPHLL